jgi:uncharacterized membrane protein (DUF106 family)
MKTASIVLTVALLIPISGNLLSAYQLYIVNSHRELFHTDPIFIIRSYAPALTFNLFALIVAVILNIKQKYLTNTVMCATLTGGYIFQIILQYGFFILFTWLKLG